jgi:hypothetical protein
VNVVLVDTGTVAVVSELDLELHLVLCHWPLADGAFQPLARTAPV